jgi:hypothetical protein
MRTKTTMAQKLPREYERKIIEFHKYGKIEIPGSELKVKLL